MTIEIELCPYWKKKKKKKKPINAVYFKEKNSSKKIKTKYNKKN